MGRCARSVAFSRMVADGTAPGSRLLIPSTAIGFTLRAVSPAGAGVAWTLGPDGSGSVFHFAAGEAYSPGNLKLADDFYLLVVAANLSLVELIVWSA